MFINFKPPLDFCKYLKDGYTTLEKAEENQTKFKSDLNEIVKVKWEYKSEEQKSEIKNIKTIYESRE